VADTLENISYAKAMSSEHQMQLLDEAALLMAESRYALCIVDSATSLFRTDFQGRGELADRQQKLAKFLRKLHILAEEYHIAVVLTNQVTANVDGGTGPKFMPIGGHIMAHSATTRLSLKKGRSGQTICKVFDSPNLAEVEATFMIDVGGVTDVGGL
jgi:DNA repair protein RAD51